MSDETPHEFSRPARAIRQPGVPAAIEMQDHGGRDLRQHGGQGCRENRQRGGSADAFVRAEAIHEQKPRELLVGHPVSELRRAGQPASLGQRIGPDGILVLADRLGIFDCLQRVDIQKAEESSWGD